VEIRFTSSPHPSKTALRVMDATVDVSWRGQMRVMETYDKQNGCDLVCFGEVVARDPFLLMGRMPKPDFALAEIVEAPKAGTVDVIQLFEPFQPAAGRGQRTCLMRGGAPRSDLLHLLLRATLVARGPELLRLVQAIDRTEKWVAMADTIRGFFTDVPAEILAAACTRYQALAIWGKTPILPRAGYDRLRDGLVSGGFVSPGTDFEVGVDNSLAEEVIALDLPMLA